MNHAEIAEDDQLKTSESYLEKTLPPPPPPTKRYTITKKKDFDIRGSQACWSTMKPFVLDKIEPDLVDASWIAIVLEGKANSVIDAFIECTGLIHGSSIAGHLGFDVKSAW
jgi:hypothetical protein